MKSIPLLSKYLYALILFSGFVFEVLEVVVKCEIQYSRHLSKIGYVLRFL